MSSSRLPSGIAEVHARAGAACAVALDRAKLDEDAEAIEVASCVGDRPVPFETQVAAARDHGHCRARLGDHASAVDIQLLFADAVDEARPARDDLGTQDSGIRSGSTGPSPRPR
jgi:hypothetical protein